MAGHSGTPDDRAIARGRRDAAHFVLFCTRAADLVLAGLRW